MSVDKEAEKIFEKHKLAFDIKDGIIQVVDGNDFNNIMSGMIMAFTEILMNCCTSQDEAHGIVLDFSSKCNMALMTFSEEGLCDWDNGGTLQ